MRAVIIDYGSGNLRSAAKAFEHAAAATGHEIAVTADAKALRAASHIVLPGVGAFADCMRGLAAQPGMLEALQTEAIEKQKPFLGICVGMQMMLERSFEHGEHKGLGWIAGSVVALQQNTPALKIPHMGWNELRINDTSHPLLKGIRSGDHAYFVHSYHAECTHTQNMLATVDYGGYLCAVLGRGNLVGTQFHPEKSQATGLRIIENFLRM